MSAADEIELANVADDLIDEFGRTVSLVPPGTTDADPTQPWKGKTSQGTPVPVSAVFQALRKELIVGTAVEMGDSLAIIASKGLTSDVTTAHVIVDGGRQWQIVAIVESKPGNTSFVWFAQVREAGV